MLVVDRGEVLLAELAHGDAHLDAVADAPDAHLAEGDLVDVEQDVTADVVLGEDLGERDGDGRERVGDPLRDVLVRPLRDRSIVQSRRRW